MANSDKVTVDRAYFEALLRRADFHTSAQILGRQDAVNNVSISRVEYDSLLRTSRDHQILKDALYQGGITDETLHLLISGAGSTDQRKDSGVSAKEINAWDDDFTGNANSRPDIRSFSQPNVAAPFQEMPWRAGGPATFNLAPGGAPYPRLNQQPPQSHLRVPNFQRQASYGMTSVPDDVAFDDESFAEESHYVNPEMNGVLTNSERRTLFFSGFSERTTYRDLLSVIKGGKLLNVNLRSERSATVTFLDGAAEFLAWAKRNDIYLNSKRVEVKWADRQYRLNGHIGNKITNGASRNLVIHSAVEKGHTEAEIRADMEHIHNLVIIDVKYRDGDAYVSMNSIHNALFARTCMMSRSTYKGCKIEFYRDECDVPLPARTQAPRSNLPEPRKKKAPAFGNRFDMLNIDGEGSSDEENRTPSDDDSDYQTTEATANIGVSLNFLDEDST